MCDEKLQLDVLALTQRLRHACKANVADSPVICKVHLGYFIAFQATRNSSGVGPQFRAKLAASTCGSVLP